MASSDTASTQNPFSSLGGTLIPNGRVPNFIISTTTATLALTPANAGTIYSVPVMANTCAVSLPPVSQGAGLSWTFRNSGATGGFDMTISATGGTPVVGVYVLSGGSVAKAAAVSTVIKAASVLGDSLTITGDGVHWFVVGISSNAAGYT